MAQRDVISTVSKKCYLYRWDSRVSLSVQVSTDGGGMRFYRGYEIPGIKHSDFHS